MANENNDVTVNADELTIVIKKNIDKELQITTSKAKIDNTEYIEICITTKKDFNDEEE